MESTNCKVEDFIFDESFQRFILEKTPPAVDKERWDNWINAHPECAAVIESAKEILIYVSERKIQPENKTQRDEVYEKLIQRINREKEASKGRKINFKYYWYAASVVVLISLSIILFKYHKPESPVTTAGQFLEVIVPNGQRSQLVLPDGTKVWLNSGSILKYPVDFANNNRKVYIEGEAFFNVQHDRNNPFLVQLKEKLCIKVLGTEFNVKSYSNEKTIETTLIKGSIKLIQQNDKNDEVKVVEMKPSDRALFEKNQKTLSISNIIAETEKKEAKKLTKEEYIEKLAPITAWKEDELVFSDETFENIAVKMERWYGFEITIVDEQLKKERFTGKFANKETIYQVLDIFNRSEPIQYTTHNKELTISKPYN
jgi:ferric-dicitrate binding protein FerR (iron transport regulator)